MDDVWCLVPHRRPGLRSSTAEPVDPAVEFNNCLNDVHPRVQFTREDEVEGSIAFLDVLLKRQDNGSISTSIYRKPSNTNITIKPQSCQHPSTSRANFKGELCRAYRLCSSPEQVKKEITFTLDLFESNGHNRKTLEQIANSYTPPTLQNKHNENRENRRQNEKNHNNNHNTDIPHNLFDVLPFAGVNLTDDAEENRPYVIVNYIPGPIYHQLKRACTKAGVSLVTRSGTKLKDLLCSCNRTQHDPTLKPGIYEFQCKCSDNAKYVGQTTRSIATRGKEHGRAADTGKWQHSGLSQHKELCKEPIEWTKPKVIKTMHHKNKKQLAYNLKVRESLEIRARGCGPGRGLNEDYGAYVKTQMWNPVFHHMDNG